MNYLRKNYQLYLLAIASLFMLFGMLSAKEVWSLETRWANIVLEMFNNHDFFHPTIKNMPYYDKPLLSYWLIAAASYIYNGLSLFTLRLPSAICGLITIACTYRLSKTFWHKKIAINCCWLLLTTYFFIYWSRIASADISNLAGFMLTITYFFSVKDKLSANNLFLLFLLMSITSLLKGLLGIVLPMLVLAPQIYDRRKLLLNLIKAHWCKVLLIPLGVYLSPFVYSSWTAHTTYSDSGLLEVFNENIVRFFMPWDHKGPIYKYLLYLPIYLLPWTLFFIPAFYQGLKNIDELDANQKWLLYVIIILLVFFTLAGSRRSYYVLPIIPFAIMYTTKWIDDNLDVTQFYLWPKRLIIGTFALIILNNCLLTPLYYADGGPKQFALTLQQELNRQPQTQWQAIMLDVDGKVPVYLSYLTNIVYRAKPKNMHEQQLIQAWPELKSPKHDQVFITQLQHAALVSQWLPNHRQIQAPLILGKRITGKKDKYTPVAFLPHN